MDKTIDKVAVEKHLSKDIGRAVYASVNVREHEVVIESRIVRPLPKRDKYSMEFNGEHILIDEPGVLVNHSCSPNCRLEKNKSGGFDFIATQDISAGEEITYDYESNESAITAFEECCCGSSQCRGIMNSGNC